MNRLVTRGLVIVGWLLTPVAAWAVSFLGGWLGAMVGGGARTDSGALGALGLGALVGGVVGATGWLLAVRAVAKYFATQRNPGDHRPPLGPA